MAPLDSNVGKWNGWYQYLAEHRLYGDATTYLMAVAFLADVDAVED